MSSSLNRMHFVIQRTEHRKRYISKRPFGDRTLARKPHEQFQNHRLRGYRASHSSSYRPIDRRGHLFRFLPATLQEYWKSRLFFSAHRRKSAVQLSPCHGFYSHAHLHDSGIVVENHRQAHNRRMDKFCRHHGKSGSGNYKLHFDHRIFKKSRGDGVKRDLISFYVGGFSRCQTS